MTVALLNSIGVNGNEVVLLKNNMIMRNLKSALSYDLSSENSYLKLFQIANQNLNLLLQEERTGRSIKRNYLEKEIRYIKKSEKG